MGIINTTVGALRVGMRYPVCRSLCVHLCVSILVHHKCIRFWLTRMKDTSLAAHEYCCPWDQSPSCRSPARVPSRRRVTATPGNALVHTSAQHPLTALRHLRAEQRGHGTEREGPHGTERELLPRPPILNNVCKMGGRGNSYARVKNEDARMSLPFAASSERRIYLRQLLKPLFRLVTAKTQTQTNDDAERDRARSTPADDSTLERTNLFSTCRR